MRRIKLTNNYVLNHKNGKWYKNGKPFTDYGLKKYKYYDPQKKIYQNYGNSRMVYVMYLKYL